MINSPTKSTNQKADTQFSRMLLSDMVEQVLFVEKLPKYFICPICLDYIKECVQTPCHHKFCTNCLYETLKNKESCPICREKVKSEDLKFDIWMDKEISCLPVYCHMREAGCKWQGELSDTKTHILKNCDHTYIPCSYKCGESILWKDLSTHNVVCTHRPTICEFCTLSVPLASMNQHLDSSCKSYKKPCDFCGVQILKVAINHHVQNDCPKFEISCPFGCSDKFLRSHQLSHNEAKAAIHNQILLERICKLEHENKMLKSLSIPFGVVTNGEILLGESFPFPEDTPLIFVWKIQRREILDSIHRRDPILSPTFQIMNTSWNITLKIKEICSLKLRLISTNQRDYIYTMDWNYEIVNHKKENSNIDMMCTHVFNLRDNSADRITYEIDPGPISPFTDLISDVKGMIIRFKVLSIKKEYHPPSESDVIGEPNEDDNIEFPDEIWDHDIELLE
jgi:hypothetical protein